MQRTLHLYNKAQRARLRKFSIMAINFPNSPTIGQKHTVGLNEWEWNGYAWSRIPDRSVGEQVVFTNLTETQRDALTAQTGGVIFNTTTNKLQVYNGTSWVDLH